MKNYEIIKIQQHKEYIEQAAQWFHEKWEVPVEAYAESMLECLNEKNLIPQWYIIMEEGKIIAGLGVIDNDFHERKDLTPNVCALYVEEEYRKQGIAGKMLQYVCEDFQQKGIDTLYLVTEHDTFYERYGWEFLCMVQEEESEEMIRMYQHKRK